MLTLALLGNVLLFVAPPSDAPAGGPAVTAREVFDVRYVRLESKEGAPERHMFGERPGLKLVLDVQGPDVVRASHYGMLQVDEAVDDQGGKIKLNDDALGFHDMRKEFVEIERDHMFFGEDNPPKDLIRIEIPFESPARKASAISVRGKLQLRQVETIDVLVPTTPGEVKHEQLEKAGLKLKIVKPEAGQSFAYDVSGKLDALHSAQLVDAQGKELETGGSMSMGDNESLHREITLEKPLPEGAKLKLALVVKAVQVPVTIDLKNVKLP